MLGKIMNKPVVLFGAIAVGAAAVVGIAAWTLGPTPYSQTQPYADDLEQRPTGAGSKPDGVVAAEQQDVPQEVTVEGTIEVGTDAVDVTGIEPPPQPEIPDDPARRTLSPTEVIDPEAGDLDPETGRVRTDSGEMARDSAQEEQQDGGT